MSFDLGDWLCFWPFPRGRARVWVRAGDACRNAGDWVQAAAHYRRSLSIEPRRRAIWVQLGHAEKERGAFQAALDAYGRASALRGDDGDPQFHTGLLARKIGDLTTAREALDAALRENPLHDEARHERLEMAHLPGAIHAAAIHKARMLCHAEQERVAGEISETLPMIFDVSDLVTYFRHARLPTGIQRVQIEVIRHTLMIAPQSQLCVFIENPGQWASIPASLFRDISTLSITSGDILEAGWLDLIETLTGFVALGLSPRFAPGACLVNLGTSWQFQNYFLHIRALQQHGIRYVPFVHDLIPIMAPQYCVTGVTQDFLGWIEGVFDHAWGFLANSRSTAADLRQVARQLDATVPQERIAIIPLDADFRRPDLSLPDVTELGRWHLQPGGYVLFVATIEARKNHALAFRAWAELIGRHGPDAIPDLICVGQKGWMNEEAHALLAGNPALSRKIRILSGLSDEHIGLLYHHCCFTLYPSHYEGWGLPVTESLCYGKVPVLTHCTSLPEAGGDLALYVAPDNVQELAATIARLWFDQPWRESLAERIRTSFHPRGWSEIAQQITNALQGMQHLPPQRDGHAPGSGMETGVLYQLVRNRSTRVTRHAGIAERWRHGTGWWALEDHGCWTKPEGGTLQIRAPEARSALLWCCLRLQGPLGQATALHITTGRRTFTWTIARGDPRWCAFPVESGPLSLAIKGAVIVDLTEMSQGQDRRRIGVGLSRIMLVDGPASTDVAFLAQALIDQGEAIGRAMQETPESDSRTPADAIASAGHHSPARLDNISILQSDPHPVDQAMPSDQ